MRAEMTYTLEVEREGDVSDCSCDYKTRAGTTYFLEAEREGNVSDRSCDYKIRAGTTYDLEVQREGNMSDYKLQIEGRDDIRPEGGEGDMSDHS
jgi:hypothetical protein